MRCPHCNQEGKPIKNNQGWYSCKNPSCNMTVWDSNESQGARLDRIERIARQYPGKWFAISNITRIRFIIDGVFEARTLLPSDYSTVVNTPWNPVPQESVK